MLVLSGLVCLIAISAFFVPFINFGVLNGEIKVARWKAAMEGPGRNCDFVNYGSVYRYLRPSVRKTFPKSFDDKIIELPVDCFAKMRLVEMRYYAQYNVVSGVYRCEDSDMIEELQLAVYLAPKSMPHDDYCSFGRFMKSWNIPVGATTKFAAP